VAVGLGASPARAQSDSTQVVAFSGGFMTTVPIGVPTFRGLEPKVSLAYMSSPGNALAGVGWYVNAASSIERAVRGRGAPRYNANDVFYLDGQLLVPCVSGSTSASCVAGGTHSTRVENYQKIQWDSANNRWFVWTKDGVKSTYSSIHTTTGGTFRWGLTSQQDTKANTVTYAWWCDPGYNCYLDTISYNTNTIKFYWELRTDQDTFATGGGYGAVRHRLKSIDVKVGSARLRVYKLTYTTSSITQRSILQSVQQYGKDAAVDSTGAVTSGSYLPAMTMSTSGGAVSMASLWGNSNMGQGVNALKWLPLDVNGDGKSDFVQLWNNGGNLAAIVYTSSGCGFTTTASGNLGSGATYLDILTGDVNGDGRADIIQVWNNGGKAAFVVFTGNANGSFTLSASVTSTAGAGAVKWLAGDVNSDGKTDVIQIWDNYGTANYILHTSDGTKPVAITSGSLGTAPDASRWLTGDVNGDGKTDIVRMYDIEGCYFYDEYMGYIPTCWTAGVSLYLATTTTTGYENVYNTDLGVDSEGLAWLIGEVNGDGKGDLIHVFNSGGNLAVTSYVSTGASFVGAWSSSLGYSAASTSIMAGDINGDGKTDIIQAYDSSFRIGLRVYTARAAYAYGYAWGTTDIGQGSMQAITYATGDFNGDGSTDFIVPWNNGGWLGLMAAKATGTTADLVSSVGNGLGGYTNVTYTPSTAWSNNLLPGGMVFATASSVSVTDGRGDLQTTNYSYEGARWNAPDREFLGFRKAITLLAATGAYSETYYWQRAGTIAKPEAIYKRRADGKILSFETFRFTENATAPYTSLVTEAWSYECLGSAVVDCYNSATGASTAAPTNQECTLPYVPRYLSGCRRVLATYGWDTYANLTTENQYGDYDLGGDERVVTRGFVANTAAYVVGLPAYEQIAYTQCESVYLKTGLLTELCYDALADYVKYSYDGLANGAAPTAGVLTKKERWNDVLGAYETHSFGYDSWGNMTSMTDPLGRFATKEYDATYHVYTTATVNPLGHRMSTGYDYVLGLPTSRTDANGAVTTYAYDAVGRVTLETGPDGSQQKHQYFNYGLGASSQFNRTSVLTPGGAWVYDDVYFDGLRREFKRTSSNGVMAETYYNSLGKVSRHSLPYVSGETVRYDQYTYDDLGRMVQEKRPNGATINHSYGVGYKTMTDPVGGTRTAYFDAWGRLTKVRENINGVAKDTAFAYDRLGRRVQAIDSSGNVTAVAYDSIGHAVQHVDPDRGLWKYEYNIAGELIAETDAANQRTTLLMDTLGRVTRRTYPNGTYDSFTFDETGRGASKGRLTTATAANGTVTRAAYDTMGRRTWYQTTIGASTYSISHSFDIAGRMATVTYPDGEVLTNTYGTSGLTQGRLTGITSSLGNTLVSAATYNARGQIASLTYGNGVTNTFAYDAYGERMASITYGSLAALSYGYDLAGRITSLTSAQLGSWTYAYDSLGRLTSAASGSTELFGYDALGRMTSSTRQGAMTYGNGLHLHAVTGAGGNTYGYDANGNMTSGAGRTITYDGGGRPISIFYGGLTTTIAYDALGQRVQKSSPNGTIVYVGGIYELRNGSAVKHYFAGGSRMARRSTADGLVFLHNDHLGSVRLATNTAGAEVRRLGYSPYGVQISSTGTAIVNHRYTGQEVDDETGLQYYRARYYDPSLGRFIQPDTIVPDANNPQDLDPYAYAYNSPTNFNDPSGNLVVAAAAAIAAWLGVSVTIVTIGIIAITVVGVALMMYGNDTWATVGMVLAGIGSVLIGGPLLGLGWGGSVAVAAAVALAQSPLSPLDPNIKKAIGWAFTIWGGLSSIVDAFKGAATSGLPKFAANWAKGSWWKSIVALAGKELVTAGGAMLFGALTSGASDDVRKMFGFVAACLVFGQSARSGPLSMIGASYDLAYSLKYPDGRVIDLTNGQGGDKWVFYYHTGYGSGMAFGRQHIRVRDPLTGQYIEIGDTGAGWYPPTLGWGGWTSISKVTVIMSPEQSAQFRQALTVAVSSGGTYWMFHSDSYTFIQAAFNGANLGVSWSSLHINPGLFHW
jgi:RHS repeat-associated protein